MALAGNHTFNTSEMTAFSSSVGGTPVVAYVRVPYRSKILGFSGVLRGAITTADGLITVAVNGTTVGTFGITQSGSAAGQAFTGATTTVANSYVNEGDVISFTPSLASGTTIGMDFGVSLREA